MSDCIRCRSLIDGVELYGLHEACFLEWFGLPSPAEFKDLDPKSTNSQEPTKKITKKKDTFFHGRYEKYSARLASQEYILKVEEEKFPELPATEYLCNRIAQILGIDVPPFHLLKFESKMTFVTRNFMQDYIGQLNHIYKFLPEGDEHHNCEVIANCILEQTGKFADVACFIEICLFDALVGNNDRHGRNLGIIDTGKFKKLAPMYDNPSFLGTQNTMLGAHFNPSGCIWTLDSREPKVAEYIKEFVRLGHKKITTVFANKVVSRFHLIVDAVATSHISEKRQKAFLKLLEERLGEFENAKQ